MREIDFCNEEEKTRFLLNRAERLTRICDLETGEPFVWNRTDPIYDENGEQIASRTNSYTITDTHLLGRLKDHAKESEYISMKKLDGQDMASAIIREKRAL